MQNQILEYKDVTLGYGQDAILKDINISIDSGVLLPFVGPNGAGKTTIFKSMLGFIQPLKGSITRNFGQCCPGYVPQQKNLDTLYPISVRQIIEMGLYAKTNFLGLLNKSEKDKLDETIEKLGLSEYQKKNFGELSGGLKQKTLIARSLAGGSSIIFMDEPVAGLDAQSEEMILNLLLELNKKENKTILLIHHKLEDLSRLSNKVCLIDKQTALFSSPREAWEQIGKR